MSKTNKQNIGLSDGVFETNVRAINNKVVIRKHEVYHDSIRKGIVVPVSADINCRMNKGTIVSIGPKAAKDLNGLEIGDDVLYDHLAAFYDTHPIVIVNAENIICAVK